MARPKGSGVALRVSTRFNKAIEDLNVAISRQVKGNGKNRRISSTEAREAFVKYGGTCAFCGLPLVIKYRKGWNALNFIYYIPLKLVKSIDPKLIIPVCEEHKEANDKYGLREDIPDINSFSDLIVVLVQTILLEKENPSVENRGKIGRIKRLLNLKLEDIALCLRYKPFKDWVPDNYEVVTEGENALPDLVEKVTNQIVSGDEPKAQEEITQCVKQLVTTKKYQVLRPPQ